MGTHRCVRENKTHDSKSGQRRSEEVAGPAPASERGPPAADRGHRAPPAPMPPACAALRVRRSQGLGGGLGSRATPRLREAAGGPRPPRGAVAGAAAGVPAGSGLRRWVGSGDRRCGRLPSSLTPSYLSSLLYRRKRLFSGALGGLIAAGSTLPTDSGVARRPPSVLPVFLGRRRLCHADHTHFREGDAPPTNSPKAPTHLLLSPRLRPGVRGRGTQCAQPGGRWSVPRLSGPSAGRPRLRLCGALRASG